MHYRPSRPHYWAISTGDGQLIGSLRFDHMTTIAWHSMRVALFETRAQARFYLRGVKGPAERGRYPDARVVKVQVSIKEL